MNLSVDDDVDGPEEGEDVVASCEAGLLVPFLLKTSLIKSATFCFAGPAAAMQSRRASPGPTRRYGTKPFTSKVKSSLVTG